MDTQNHYRQPLRGSKGPFHSISRPFLSCACFASALYRNQDCAGIGKAFKR